jgi:hypothetical protein
MGAMPPDIITSIDSKTITRSRILSPYLYTIRNQDRPVLGILRAGGRCRLIWPVRSPELTSGEQDMADGPRGAAG